MPQPSYPFAATRVRSRENSILKHDQLVRINDAGTAAAAMEMLTEYGFVTNTELLPEDFEKAISDELDRAYSFVEEITPEKQVTDLFFLKFDYHNLKVILKNEHKGTGASVKSLINRGTIDPREMYDSIKDKRYTSFPPEMREALTAIEKRFSIKPDISYISFALDAAYAKEVTRRAAATKDKNVIEFYRCIFTMNNVTAVLRLKRAGADREVYAQCLTEGGETDMFSLLHTYDMAEDEAMAYLARGSRGRDIAAAYDHYRQTGSMALFKKAEDDALIRLATEGRDDMFSVAPVLAYLILKAKEAEAVRLIMVGKLNGVSAETVSSLLPDM